MAYCTLDDLKKRIEESVLIQLTDDEKTGSVNTDRINEAIDNAGSQIDGFCEARYTVPFTTVPSMVKTMAEDIALYYLFMRKPVNLETAQGQSIAKQFNNTIRLLERIAEGKLTLGQPEAPSAQTMDIKSRTKIFDTEDFEDRY